MISEAERIISLDHRHAEAWDSERGRSLPEQAWLDQLLALLTLSAFILDMGCGSGEPIARYFVENGCDVTGIDSAPSFIAICKLGQSGIFQSNVSASRNWAAARFNTIGK
jgi:SAM-dependent methyltransferase